jgi:hypothetical protein
MMVDELNASFVERLAPHVGSEVAVWKVTLFKPYAGGELLRVERDHLVVAGHGVIPFAEVDLVGVGGVEIKYAVPL